MSKNGKLVFSKLTLKISSSVSGKQASQHLFSIFTLIFFSQIFTYFPVCGTSSAFHFRQMFNGFLTSTFNF